MRLSRKDFESQRSKMYGPQNLWYHLDCFVEKRDEIGFSENMDPTKLVNYNFLTNVPFMEFILVNFLLILS